MLLKCCTQYDSKFGKLSSGHRTGKGQFSFQPQRKAVPKNVQATQLHYHTITLISHTSRVMLKILQARLQQYVNRELPDVPAGFRKGRGTRDQIANIHQIIEKESSRKTSTSASLTTLKPLTVWLKTNCEKFFKRWEYETTLPASWEICMQVKKHQTWNNRLAPNWERSTSRLYMSPCLFHLYVEYIMWNARLDEAQAGIQISGRNINNLRYANDTTLMAERGTKKPLDKGERGAWKSWLKAQHSKNEDHGIQSHHFMANRWGNNGNSDRLYFLRLQNHCRWWLQSWN